MVRAIELDGYGPSRQGGTLALEILWEKGHEHVWVHAGEHDINAQRLICSRPFHLLHQGAQETQGGTHIAA